MEPYPLPPLIIQSVGHAVEAVSQLLLSALTLDPTGTAQHHLVCVVHSLLGLELALKGHRDTLSRCTREHPLTLSSHPSLTHLQHAQSHSNLSEALLKTLSKFQKDRDTPSLASLAGAVEAAITRLVTGYRDILATCVFPSLYAEALKIKLSAL